VACAYDDVCTADAAKRMVEKTIRFNLKFIG
jgi:hypothetical protein